MSFILSGSPQSCLASAAGLLQVELGIGFILGALGIGSSATPALKKQLAAMPWETTWRAAAKAVAPVPVLVASALLQAQAASDVFVSVGFLVSSTAIALGAFLAVLETMVGAEEGDATPQFLKATRVLNACRAFGQALLVFTAMPEGMQLTTVACFVRAALAAQVVGAAVGALSLSGVVADSLATLEPMMSLAPVLTVLALLDSATWGTGSMAGLPLQPGLYGLAQIALVVVGQVAGAEVKQLQNLFGALMQVVMVLSVGYVASGTFAVELTLGGVLIQWGDLLTAAAVELSGIIIGVQVLEYVMAKVADEPEHNGVNGINGDEPEQLEKTPSAMDYLKAIVAPAHVLLLALMAARMLNPPLDAEMDRVSLLAVAPFRYGFILAVMAVFLQVAAFLVYVVSDGDLAEPPFDATGTICWQAKGGISKHVAEFAQWLTHALLEGGLLLGCIGLGPVTWVVGGGLALGLLAAGSKNRSQAIEVVKGMLVAMLSSGGAGGLFSALDGMLESRREAHLAAAAERAAAVATDLQESETKAPKKGGAATNPKTKLKGAVDAVVVAQQAQQDSPQKQDGGSQKLEGGNKQLGAKKSNKGGKKK